jgi:cytochrome d ubiquinol oxidase subunit II
MTLADAVLGVMFLGVTAYALFGGADFGAGFWDLLAGGTRRGAAQRRLIERSLGPVWEANHVWLIFVLVVLWTAFPVGFASIASTLYLPLSLAAFGMIARGSAFAFRHSVTELPLQRALGAAFAFSSVVTPFFLGTVAGAVASGRVPPGIAAGNVVTSWLNPVSVLGGVLAVGTCAYLAAVYLCADAARAGEAELASQFRVRALVAAVVTGAIALAGIAVLASGAPRLFDGLTGRGLPMVALSAAAGLTSMVLLARRRFGYARIAAALAVAAILWGWALGQYPYLLTPYLTIGDAAGAPATLTALLTCMIAGAVILVPSLWFLYRLFQQGPAADAAVTSPRAPRTRSRPGR